MDVDPAALYGPGGPLYGKTEEEANEFFAAMLYSKDKGASLGPFLMGFAIDMFFWGVVVTQFFRWLSIAHPDRAFVKICVYVSFTLATTYSVLTIVFQMRVFVFGFGTYARFTDMGWLTIFVALEAFVAFVAQIFYADRAHRLIGPQRNGLRYAFVGFFTLFLLVEIGGGMAGVVMGNTAVKSLLDAYKIVNILYIWLGAQLAADMLITVSTGLALWRSRTGWSNTDKIIKRLITFTVETQLPPTVVALVYICYYTLHTDSTVHIALNYAMGKPYLIGMFAVLNDRVHIRNEMSNTFVTSGHNAQNTFQMKSTRPQQATVHVFTETYTETSPGAHIQVGLNRQTSDEFDKDFKDGNSDHKTEIGDSTTHLTRV